MPLKINFIAHKIFFPSYIKRLSKKNQVPYLTSHPNSQLIFIIIYEWNFLLKEKPFNDECFAKISFFLLTLASIHAIFKGRLFIWLMDIDHSFRPPSSCSSLILYSNLSFSYYFVYIGIYIYLCDSDEGPGEEKRGWKIAII